jgi:hypothetical protein
MTNGPIQSARVRSRRLEFRIAAMFVRVLICCVFLRCTAGEPHAAPGVKGRRVAALPKRRPVYA